MDITKLPWAATMGWPLCEAERHIRLSWKELKRSRKLKNHNSSYYLFDRICYLSHSNPAPWDGLIHFWIFVLAVSSTCHVHPSDISVAGSLNLLQDFAQLAPSREATCNHMIENNIHHSLSLYSASFSYTMLITFEILSICLFNFWLSLSSNWNVNKIK